MVFSSTVFLFIFLPVVFVLHWLLPEKYRNGLLLIASLLFYGWGEPYFVLVMLASIVINTLLAIAIEDARSPGRRRALAGLSAFINIALLVVFKYTGFIVENLNSIPGVEIPVPAIRLPIGISFFTFQAMSYVLDVYRERTRAQRSVFKVALYISFFPQLIAGPIVKYHDIAEQIEQRTITTEGVALGIRRFIVGLSKKLLIANVMGEIADRVFALPAADVNMPVAWIGALAYCFQIFFDFCGYSDMAIGMGSMFGFTILENFRFPYVSLSVREFWRRWHISLSTWFREYLYIPLGGNRKGRARECLNKCIVFLCTGLWHGASWTFVLWGLFHGFFLILETLHVIRAGKRMKALSWLYTMLVVAVGFVLFRADTLGQAVSMIGAMFTGFRMNARHLSLIGEMLSPTVLITTAAAVLASIPIVPALERRLTAPRAAVWLRSTGYAATIVLFFLCVLSLSSATYNPFIYFRF